MSSEALERATVQVRKALDGHFKRGVGGCTTCHKGHDALDALLAEVARLEQERDEKDAELWRWMNKPGGINRKYGWIPKQEADELRAALAVAREREQRATTAMVEAAIPLEVLAGQIRTKPYRELTDELQAEIERAVLIIRAALEDEPAAATGTPAATLAEPEGIHGSAVTAEAAPPGSASAAADEPGEAPQVRRGVGRIVGHRERPPMVVGDDEARGGVSPSGKERGE